MADIAPTVAVGHGLGGTGPYGTLTLQWALANGDDGVPGSNTTVYSDVSFQATGTFGAGGSIAVEGSNDGGLNWEPLHNAQGVTIALTGPSITTVLEAVQAMRPRVTAGDGTTALTVTAFFRRTY